MYSFQVGWKFGNGPRTHKDPSDESPHGSLESAKNHQLNKSKLVGGFSPTHLKNMLVKLDHETPRIGVKIKNIWNHHPASIGNQPPSPTNQNPFPPRAGSTNPYARPWHRGETPRCPKFLPQLESLELLLVFWKVAISRVIYPGPPTMGPPYGKRDQYHSHIFRDSGLGVGLGNSMGSLP